MKTNLICNNLIIFFLRSDSEPLQLDDEYISHILKMTAHRITKLEDLVSENFSYLWALKELPINEDDISSVVLDKFREEITQLDFRNRENLTSFLKEFSKSHSFKFPKFMQIMRILFTSQKVSQIILFNIIPTNLFSVLF